VSSLYSPPGQALILALALVSASLLNSSSLIPRGSPADAVGDETEDDCSLDPDVVDAEDEEESESMSIFEPSWSPVTSFWPSPCEGTTDEVLDVGGVPHRNLGLRCVLELVETTDGPEGNELNCDV